MLSVYAVRPNPFHRGDVFRPAASTRASCQTLGIMKTAFTSLLVLLVALVAADVVRVVALWSYYHLENVLVHFSFAVGVLVIVGCNAYFIKFGTLASISSQVKLFLSFLGQFATLFFFSNLIVLAWIGCKPCKASKVEWNRLSTMGFMLFLLLLFVAFILWSKRLAMPNPSVKRDWLKPAPYLKR